MTPGKVRLPSDLPCTYQPAGQPKPCTAMRFLFQPFGAANGVERGPERAPVGQEERARLADEGPLLRADLPVRAGDDRAGDRVVHEPQRLGADALRLGGEPVVAECEAVDETDQHARRGLVE